MPTPADLLTHAEPQELALSPNGDRVLLRVRRGRVQENEYAQQTRLLPTAPDESPTTLDVPARAHDFEWLPDGKRLAYLAPAETGEQVWIKPLDADSARQVTRRSGGVERFSVSPSGRRLAFVTRARLDRSKSNADSTAIDGIGEAIDVRTASFRTLQGDRLTADPPPASRQQLWTKALGDQHATTVTDSLTVDEYRWSPSGDRLAFTGTPTRIRAQHSRRVPTFRTDLYVYTVDTTHLRTVYTGRLGNETIFDEAVSYASPFWGPSGERLGVLRTDHSDRSAAVAELVLRDLEAQTTRALTSANNRELDSPRFHWTRPGSILVEYTREARRGLFRLSLEDGTITPLHVPVEYASGFSFGADGWAAWIQQSVGAPPEVYVDRRPFDSPRQLSQLNQDLRAHVWLPDAEPVEWTSRDGTLVQGWFIPPRGPLDQSPPPLLTVLHGGPGIPSVNQYHPYDGGWLYPVQVFAARGYAVFLPNYRQTDSFGKAFQQVEAPDEEAVADVLTGIDHLAAEGRIDSSRVGLLGHSHGAWLGPMVAAERPSVEAASFAEGLANYLSLYGQREGWRNRGLHEYAVGPSPYDAPQRYMELSPAFQNSFTQNVPTLLEAGQRAGAFQWLEAAKALWRHGTSHKFIVYPGVGHGIRQPAVHLESMTRNLRWFEQRMPAGPSPEK